ncbi:hypothetical protein DHEL01_v200394 [Diaporthe helianthi]|uniref:Oxidase ustYa n=1 Tax=Diaporthe helianthi TaxID=158607 RepID=A0A2P5IFA5_DIAHE|nr:hypothetical protein DHEL01_v200394 [Diaporthe helianthi]
MGNDTYTSVPLDDGPEAYALGAAEKRLRSPRLEKTMRVAFLSFLTVIVFLLGFTAGDRYGKTVKAVVSPNGRKEAAVAGSENNGTLLSPKTFVPDFPPLKEVKFDFPTDYEDTSVKGDKLWDELMPIGSGFVRVPFPRRFDMPASKAIEDDPEEAEIYSLSALHQLHCLGVIRDVVKKYEKHDKSRFAGSGHEYHCIDYIRQSIMCSADTTLDFAELQPDGRRKGFSGANSTHQCRDWDALTSWAVENRAGDKAGIA